MIQELFFKSLCNLVEFNKMDEHLENKFSFEDEFERDEI
jgi:hypothetical protein